jgi:excisionase family DNA binding protein
MSTQADRVEGDLWKPKELADLLGVKRPTIYAWILADKLKAIRTPGGNIRIPAEEVNRLLRDGVEETSDSPLT